MKSHKSVLVIGMNGVGLMPTTQCKVTNKYGTFSLYDKVQYAGQIGWITGFSGKSTVFIKNKENKYLPKQSSNDTHIPLANVIVLSHNNNWVCFTK